MVADLRMIYVCALALGVLFGGVVFAPSASVAQTRDPDLPAIDPPGRGRVMTHDDLTSTSNCIGFPITPMCAVETKFACFVRRDNKLCRIAMGLDRSPELYRGQPIPDYYLRYRVLSAKRFGEHDLPPPHHLSPSATPAPWWFPEDRQKYQPGDVQIVVLMQTCQRNPTRCDPLNSTDRYTYHLRRMGENWAALISKTPDPRLEDITPENF